MVNKKRYAIPPAPGIEWDYGLPFSYRLRLSREELVRKRAAYGQRIMCGGV